MKTLCVTAAIVVMFAGCSGPSAEELSARAKEAREAKNYPLAIENYTRIAKEYPGTAAAETSLFVLGAIRSNDTHEFTEAIHAYRSYLEQYPDGSHAPEAMFLVGYIYNNELHSLDSAAEAYRTFLASYPEDQMAQSARFELENLGKSPEEILPKDVVAERPAPPGSHTNVQPRGKTK
jgi:TolA-binding protein